MRRLRTSAPVSVRKTAKHSFEIPFDHMKMAADDALSITRGLAWFVLANITEKVQGSMTYALRKRFRLLPTPCADIPGKVKTAEAFKGVLEHGCKRPISNH